MDQADHPGCHPHASRSVALCPASTAKGRVPPWERVHRCVLRSRQELRQSGRWAPRDSARWARQPNATDPRALLQDSGPRSLTAIVARREWQGLHWRSSPSVRLPRLGLTRQRREAHPLLRSTKRHIRRKAGLSLNGPAEKTSSLGLTARQGQPRQQLQPGRSAPVSSLRKSSSQAWGTSAS